MRFLSRIKAPERGFTLIEVLIIAPIVILAISGFVALMITMIGDSLATRDQNTMVFETQDALDRIEQDTRLTSQFLVTSLTMPSPQGSDSNFTGTAAFSNSNSLILGVLTTDKNPADSTRQLVYYAKQPNDCGSLQSYNRIFQGKIVYFIKDGSLWRRTVLPDYNTNATPNDSTVCSVPWQRNTCSPGYVASRCQTNDIEIMKNIDTFTVKYLESPSSTTDLGASQALSAESIEVTITGKKTIKGRAVTSSGVIRGTRLNNIDVDLPLPTTPVVTATNNATTAIFNWDDVPNATSYLISYNINGGSWVDATVNGDVNSYSVDASLNDTISIRVSAKNSTGTSPYGTAAVTIPAWNECNLQNGWQNYENGYAHAAYTKTKESVVLLKGLIRFGTTSVPTTVCTLPEGYRPSKVVMFQTASNGSTLRLDVLPNGEVRLDTGINAAWATLDGVYFVADGAPYTWTDLTFQNGWVNYGFEYATLQATQDTTGRVHIRGLTKNGAYANPTAVTTLPVNMRAPEYMYFPARSNPASFNYMAVQNTIDAKGHNGSGWYSLQTMYYPTSFSGWTSLPLYNGWVEYATTHSRPRYTKSADGVVTVKGLVKNGVTGSGTVIGKLPVGYRPKEQHLYHTIINGASGGAYGRIDVMPNGDIVTGVVSATSTSLDVIQFVAEQ